MYKDRDLIFSIYIVYMSRCLNCWARLTQKPTQRYPKKCNIRLRNLDNVGIVTWASHIRHFLFHTRFGYSVSYTFWLWLDWLCSLYSSKDVCTSGDNKHYAPNVQVEQYLSDFRCSHNCLIEKERRLNLDKNNRICPICLQIFTFIFWIGWWSFQILDLLRRYLSALKELRYF